MKILIGYNGLIGSTISNFEKFDYFFNSKNIEDFEKLVPNNSELFLCCLSAKKWIVNQNINDDIDNIYKIYKILTSKFYSKITLISTIDVYSETPLKSNEDTIPKISTLNYGTNRYIFELLISQLKTNDLKIFRLPALFNKKIKKNILYDLLNNNNLSQLNPNTIFQWYNLDNIFEDICFFNKNFPKEKIFNLFNEPIPTKYLLDYFPKLDLDYSKNNYEYDYTTKFSKSGYLRNKNKILNEIKILIDEISSK